MIAYIGLGSNLDNPKQQIKNSLIALNSIEDIKVINLSSLYQSKPIDDSNQPDYLNAVAKVNTHLSALELLTVCQFIEDKQGRKREKKWGARTIDLDILVYGVQVIASKKLIVPHPEMMNRAFVLVPLAEIEPDFDIPILGNIRQLIKNINQNSITKLATV